MITEIAQIDIKPGSEKDFEAAIALAESIFKRCKGWKGFELSRSIEKPSRYRLHIKWETVENHMVDFREGPDFAEWRALVGPHFASPPEVEHATSVLSF
jgi:heme-degrading monooxygenase HmoA